MKKSIKLFITILGICLSAIMPCQLFAFDANSQTEFSIDTPHADASNIKVFSFEQGTVFFKLDGKKGGPNRWVSHRHDGNIELFEEIYRDEWTIKIKEYYPAAKEFRIDFHTDKTMWEGQGEQGKIISTSDQFSN